jgi:hypothetical protein
MGTWVYCAGSAWVVSRKSIAAGFTFEEINALLFKDIVYPIITV